MSINRRNVTFIVADKFKNSEYQVPKETLEKEGAIAKTISIKLGEIKS